MPLALGMSMSPGALAQSTATAPEILVLGTYHMANPGHDIHNMQADDVLSPKRQQEITQLIEVLQRFHPTMITIESDPDGPRPQQYTDYVAGKHELSRNEIEQIGFRLAKELGHTTIYPVDVDSDFPYERVVNWAKANGKGAAFDSLEARTAARTDQVADRPDSRDLRGGASRLVTADDRQRQLGQIAEARRPVLALFRHGL